MVTEAMMTDLYQVIRSKPLEGQFVQFFTYQILVRLPLPLANIAPSSPLLTAHPARIEIHPFGRHYPPGSETSKPPRQRQLRPQDLRLRARPPARPPNDRLRRDAVLSRPGGDVDVAAL